MSFDVFFQGFENGDAKDGGGVEMRQVLAAHIVREEPEHNFALIETGDGSADVYLGTSSMLANYIGGDEIWDLLVDGATAARWVILPVGCPTCITDESQRSHLPEDLGQDVVLVRTGAELSAVIQSA
jgi:hypothetical protein